jgi:hypothetical protein
MESLLERERQTPQQVKLIEDLRNKSELRKLQMLSSCKGGDFYLEKKVEDRGVKEMTESISYAMAFLFSFFMAGLTGYYFAHFVLGWDFASSMVLALLFIFATIILETSLFIVRQYPSTRRAKGQPQAKARGGANHEGGRGKDKKD